MPTPKSFQGVFAAAVLGFAICGCGSSGVAISGTGGTAPAGGATGKGGEVSGSGGHTGTGGVAATGGASGGETGSGGAPMSGGALGSGGVSASGGASGGQTGAGGSGAGGRDGGTDAGKGGMGGGTAGTSGATGGSTSPSTVDIDCNAAMPSGGQQHSGNSQGGSGSLAWSLWQNGNGGSITTYPTPAFGAAWGPNSGDFLARIGLEWGGSPKPYTQYGNIIAQYSYKKTGTGGGYSYIGIYGWSTNPCVEWYIVDDSYGNMPFNPWNATAKGTPTSIDGEMYKFFSNNTNGTGGSRCSGVSTWLQFWSVRQKARQCGQISITQHFDAWKAAGMTLGNMLEAKILVEVGGGTGTIEFPIANVTAK